LREIAATRRLINGALVNDEKIRKAVMEDILDKGVDRLSLRGVGQHAGLTHGATYARFEDTGHATHQTAALLQPNSL